MLRKIVVVCYSGWAVWSGGGDDDFVVVNVVFVVVLGIVVVVDIVVDHGEPLWVYFGKWPAALVMMLS